MSLFEYNYTISNDFGNDVSNLDMETLHKVIDASIEITAILDSINLNGDVVVIEFETELTAGEQTSLDSIIENHVPIEKDYSIMYGAIVDTKGNGDYSTISEAISAGKKSLFIRSGIYIETSNINLPDNFYLVGEDKTSVIVHFYGTNSGFVVDGGNNIENTGTVSILNGSTTVTGTGTSFTNLRNYDYIQLGTSFHHILSIESDTSLTLRNSYRGPNLSGNTFKASTYKTGSIQNLSMGFSTGSLITLNKAINVTMKDLGLAMSSNGLFVSDSFQYLLTGSVVHNCGYGINISESSMFSLSNIIVKNSVVNGLLLANSESLLLDSLYVYNSGQDGIKIVSGGKNVEITECISNENNGSGIVSNATGNLLLQTCTTSDNGVSGILSLGSGYDSVGSCISSGNVNCGFQLSNNSSLTGCISTNNGIGVDISGVTGCVITGGLFSNNTFEGVLFNVGTVDSLITTCQVNDNGTTGLNVLGTDNTISLCVCKRNTTSNITDNGTTSTVVNNKS